MFISKGKGVIRLGDSTTHGGKVISVAHMPTDQNIPIACVGDMAVCPKCKGAFPIVEGAADCTIEGPPCCFPRPQNRLRGIAHQFGIDNKKK